MKTKPEEEELAAAVGLLRQLASLRMSMGRDCSVDLLVEMRAGRIHLHVVNCSLRVYDKSEWAREDGDDVAETRKPDYTG